jgi:hypothetical protein
MIKIILGIALLLFSSLASMEFFNLSSGVISRIIEGSLTEYDKGALKVSPYIFPCCLLGCALLACSDDISAFLQRKTMTPNR